MSLFRSLKTMSLLALLALGGSAAFAQNATHLVISQVYGGGGSTATNPTPTYTNDFVELFNPTASAISLNGLSVQYGAATTAAPGTYSGVTVLPNVSIQPGHFFLVGEASATGATGSALSTADASGSISMSGSAGRVALVNGTTAVNCSAASATFIDRVGYGSVNAALSGCYETSPTAAPTNTQYSLVRSTPCTDGDNNSTDFTQLTPAAARTSTSSSPACYGSTTTALGINTATASPSSVAQGGMTALTVVVTPGSTSTGIAVTANLGAIGGSTTQALSANGVNTYTFSYTVPSNTATNSYSLPVTVTDQQSGKATGSISLTVQAAQSITPISTLQTNRSTYAGQTVTTQGVVTLLTSTGWYMQTADSNPQPNEGLLVYAGSGKVPSNVTVGQNVVVSGVPSLYPATTVSHAPSLEFNNPTVVSSTSGTVPPPVAIPVGTPATGSLLTVLQPYESMLVKFPSVTTTSGTDGNLVETSETETSNGEFFAVATGVARPFREPGIDFRDFPYATCPTATNCTSTATTLGVTRPSNAVIYDDSDERILVDTGVAIGSKPLDVSANAIIPNLTGVVDYSFTTDSFDDPARIIPLPGTLTTANVQGGLTVQNLAPAGPGQITVAAFNIERFYNTLSSDNKDYYAVTNQVEASSAITVTQAAYARRLQKVSLAIRNVLQMPDIISTEENENVAVLNDISAQISKDAIAAGQPDPGYVAYSTDSVNTFTNDVSGISVGFLVKPSTVNVVKWEQIGTTTLFTNAAGNPAQLNDRPSQVLHVGIKRAGASDYPLTIISNHLKALTGVNAASPDTRTKKELQAEMLATAIQGYQQNGEHVIAVGDFNAFEFSDGYTDTLGTVTGRLSPSGTAVQPGMLITNPALTDMTLTLPQAQRQSYTEDGVAQVLDHVVVTSDLVGASALAYGHIDADFPLTALNDATTPARSSDHDPALLYLNVPAAPAPAITLTALPYTAVQGQQDLYLGASLQYTGPAPTAQVTFTVDSDGPALTSCSPTYTANQLGCGITFPGKYGVGPHTITVKFAGDANYPAQTSTATLTINSPGPAMTITVPSITGTAGAATTVLHYTISYTGSVPPNGGAGVLVDGQNPVNVACSAFYGTPTPQTLTCQWPYPTGSLAPGQHTVTAFVLADGNYPVTTANGTLNLQ